MRELTNLERVTGPLEPIFGPEPTDRHGSVLRAANRPPDAALSPVDVAFLGQEDRIRVLVDERAAAMAQRDTLLEQVRRLETQRAELERHLERAIDSWTIWRNETLAEQAAVRRASYLAAALFCALVLAEGWRVLAWIWRML